MRKEAMVEDIEDRVNRITDRFNVLIIKLEDRVERLEWTMVMTTPSLSTEPDGDEPDGDESEDFEEEGLEMDVRINRFLNSIKRLDREAFTRMNCTKHSASDDSCKHCGWDANE